MNVELDVFEDTIIRVQSYVDLEDTACDVNFQKSLDEVRNE